MGRWVVADVMTTAVATVRADTPYKEIVDVLIERGVSAVPVLDVVGHVVGVVSEADLLHKVELAGSLEAHRLLESRQHRSDRHKAAGTDAGDLMSAPAVTIPADATVRQAARLLEEGGIKRLPVVDRDGRLVGIVSRRDLLKGFLQSDDALRETIIDRILRRALWVSPEEVHVDVTEGVVTLTGRLDRKSLIPITIRLTEGVDGVVDVNARLTYSYDDTDDLRAELGSPTVY